MKRKHKCSVRHIQTPQVSNGSLGLSLLQIHKQTLMAKRWISGYTHAVSVAAGRLEISKYKNSRKSRESQNRIKWKFYVWSEWHSEDALWLERVRKNWRVCGQWIQKGRHFCGLLKVPASFRSWQTGPRSGEESWQRSIKEMRWTVAFHFCSL